MSNILSHTNGGESWKTYSDKIEKSECEKAQSLSLSISSSRSSSIYASHTYESTQFSSPKICNAYDEIIGLKKSLTEGIQVLQCRDCSNVCHEKCRPIASYKPCRKSGVSELSHSQIVVNSIRFVTASVIDQL